MTIDIGAIRARQRARRERPDTVGSTLEADIEQLLDALDAATRELHELRQDNEDLRASSTMWADLYEASASRESTRYQQLVEVVASLQAALEELLVQCLSCLPRHGGRVRALPIEEFCTRCVKAATALERSRIWVPAGD